MHRLDGEGERGQWIQKFQSLTKNSRDRKESGEDRATSRMHPRTLLLDQQQIFVPGDNELVRPMVFRKTDVNASPGLHPTRKRKVTRLMEGEASRGIGARTGHSRLEDDHVADHVPLKAVLDECPPNRPPTG
jgi:hypothetical protein